ncbi:MAG TPA: hypothetical protein VMU48_04780 [Terracidiphilus sp.]|nr:hypothetical protein [Terracidiphilus sp.]
MKTVVIGLGALAAVFVGIMAYNVWRGETTPVEKTPGIVEQGREDLHAKLLEQEQREAQIEKLYWNSPEQLRVLIKSHQQRIDQLRDNTAGAEIVSHDKDAIARLEKRIADIEAEQAAQAKSAEEARKAQQESLHQSQ